MKSVFETNRRVVISGIGVVSPIGNNVGEFWQSLVEGRSGISVADSSGSIGESIGESTGESTGQCVGAVLDFTGHIDDFGPLEKSLKKSIRKGLKLMNRETQMGVAAAQQALVDSGLAEAGYGPARVGVCFGAGNVSMLPEDFIAAVQSCTNDSHEFEFSRWGRDGLEQVAPLWLLKCLPNMPACHIAIYHQFQGPNNTITLREAAANSAVAEAFYTIVEGAADAMMTGGTGTTILPYNKMQANYEDQVSQQDGTTDPATISRPFDLNRTGSVIAEGAAAFVLEEYEAAIRRGAPIYGEILGAGSSCVVTPGRVARRQVALTNAIHAALRNARLSPDGIGHVHAHGLSTQHGDIEEANAIREVFGDRTAELPVVAAKANTGNAGAGSGAMELVASLLAMKQGRLFPVLNYEQPDPDCPISPVQSTEQESGDSFLNLNVVAQGQASCLAVQACE